VTTTDGYLTLLPLYPLIPPALAVAIWILRRRADRRWTLFALLALAHVTLVVALTIFPIPIAGQDYYRRTRGFSEDNIVPFGTISWQLTHLTWNNLRQLVGNMLALAPLGVYAPQLWPRLRDPRRFLILAIAFGVGIELCQLAGSLMEGFTYRVTDVDDALMNAAGAMAGFFIWHRLEGSESARGIAARAVESLPWRPKTPSIAPTSPGTPTSPGSPPR
jgi:glycopeptide antibiotics resistance protein